MCPIFKSGTFFHVYTSSRFLSRINKDYLRLLVPPPCFQRYWQREVRSFCTFSYFLSQTNESTRIKGRMYGYEDSSRENKQFLNGRSAGSRVWAMSGCRGNGDDHRGYIPIWLIESRHTEGEPCVAVGESIAASKGTILFNFRKWALFFCARSCWVFLGNTCVWSGLLELHGGTPCVSFHLFSRFRLFTWSGRLLYDL